MKAIFTEVNKELGLSVIVGELQIQESQIDKANEIARTTAKMLEDVRGNSISFMLSKNNAILAKVDGLNETAHHLVQVLSDTTIEVSKEPSLGLLKQTMLEDLFIAMVKKPIENGETVKIGKNQIFQDNRQDVYKYVVEKYEFTENGTDMFSVHDGYRNLIDAVNVALNLK